MLLLGLLLLPFYLLAAGVLAIAGVSSVPSWVVVLAALWLTSILWHEWRRALRESRRADLE